MKSLLSLCLVTLFLCPDLFAKAPEVDLIFGQIQTKDLAALNKQEATLAIWMVKNTDGTWKVRDDDANAVKDSICKILTNDKSKYVLGTKIDSCKKEQLKINASILTGSAIQTNGNAVSLDSLISAANDSKLINVLYNENKLFILDLTKGYVFGLNNTNKGNVKINYMVRLKEKQNFTYGDHYTKYSPDIPDKITKDMVDDLDQRISLYEFATAGTSYTETLWMINIQDFTLIDVYDWKSFRCACPISLVSSNGKSNYSLLGDCMYKTVDATKEYLDDVYISAKLVQLK